MIVVGLTLASLVFLNTAVLLPVSAVAQNDPAPCHQDSSTPLPASHHQSNHDCCTVGHNRALPSYFADLSATPAVFIAQIIPNVTLIDSQEHRSPGFNDSSPPGSAPLRI